eukprot:131079-Amphidinium_carterae.2
MERTCAEENNEGKRQDAGQERPKEPGKVTAVTTGSKKKKVAEDRWAKGNVKATERTLRRGYKAERTGNASSSMSINIMGVRIKTSNQSRLEEKTKKARLKSGAA